MKALLPALLFSTAEPLFSSLRKKRRVPHDCGLSVDQRLMGDLYYLQSEGGGGGGLASSVEATTGVRVGYTQLARYWNRNRQYTKKPS